MKVRTADINPILHKIAHFNRVNKENKKRDKSQKQDLSQCVVPIDLFSKQNLNFLCHSISSRPSNSNSK